MSSSLGSLVVFVLLSSWGLTSLKGSDLEVPLHFPKQEGIVPWLLLIGAGWVLFGMLKGYSERFTNLEEEEVKGT